MKLEILLHCCRSNLALERLVEMQQVATVRGIDAMDIIVNLYRLEELTLRIQNFLLPIGSMTPPRFVERPRHGLGDLDLGIVGSGSIGEDHLIDEVFDLRELGELLIQPCLRNRSIHSVETVRGELVSQCLEIVPVHVIAILE